MNSRTTPRTQPPTPVKGWHSLRRALGSVIDQPEKRLMLAVLDDAMDTVLADGRFGGVRERRLRHTTEAWFAADDHEWPFSFVRVCQALDLDPSQVRRSLASVRLARIAAHRTSLDTARTTARREDVGFRWTPAGRPDGPGRFGRFDRWVMPAR